jgi:hypothetical protein
MKGVPSLHILALIANRTMWEHDIACLPLGEKLRILDIINQSNIPSSLVQVYHDDYPPELLLSKAIASLAIHYGSVKYGSIIIHHDNKYYNYFSFLKTKTVVWIDYFKGYKYFDESKETSNAFHRRDFIPFAAVQEPCNSYNDFIDFIVPIATRAAMAIIDSFPSN